MEQHDHFLKYIDDFKKKSLLVSQIIDNIVDIICAEYPNIKDIEYLICSKLILYDNLCRDTYKFKETISCTPLNPEDNITSSSKLCHILSILISLDISYLESLQIFIPHIFSNDNLCNKIEQVINKYDDKPIQLFESIIGG